MSQFGGAGKPGWGRPGQPAQLPNFSGIGGVGAPFGMMGMPVINPQAFAQPGMLGVGVMPAAVAQQQRPQQNAPAAMANNAAVAAKTRTFVGVVTKMHDSYGFVDDDVFFQHSVIRGQHPRVGEKVMVEANYNPQMPFKWNAFRIQLLSAAGAGEVAQITQPRAASPSPQRGQPTGGGSSRWGPSGDRHGAPKTVASPPRRRSPARRSPIRRQSPPRGAAPRRKSPPPRRSPPPARRTSPIPSRKRERSPAASTASSVKRDSTSPPRRRARIIPRYDFKQTKQVVKGGHLSTMGLKSRYNRLYIPSDFVEMNPEWPLRVPIDASIDLTNPVQFHVFHKDVDYPEGEVAVLEPEDADPRHQVKVLLLAHAGKTEVLKKALGLLPDGSTDDNHEVTSIFKQLQILVGTRGKENMAIGGSWSPSLDGPDPTDPRTLIKTAIRTTKALTGVDLSGVPQWYSLVQLRYYRSDKDRMDQVLLLWPDTQLLMPFSDSWETVSSLLRQQLDAKLAAVDTLTVEAPPPASSATTTTTTATPTTAVADAKESLVLKTLTPQVEEVKKEDEEEAEAVPEKPKHKPTHWNDLDVKIMKVAELKHELEARGLETRGIKTLLCSRLQEALDKEQELEEDGPPDVVAAETQPEPIKEEEVMEVDSTPAEGEEEKPVEVKSEAELKKEAEEHQKKVDTLEKEKTEKKAALEKHFTFPKEPKILVYPSKTAKNGKFDCKVTTLQNLLEYRHDDNKETQFEVSIYAEAFKEMLERHSAFVIYQNLASAADRESERKRREEAAVKPQENGDVAEEEKDKEEKKEKPEKIELKGVVSNRALFEACAMFDTNLCGYFHDRDMEELILNCDFAASRGQISRILQKVCGKSDRFTYRHMTDNLVDSDGNVRFEPGKGENAPTMETLLLGYGSKFENPNSPAVQTNGTSKVAEDVDTVIINGNVINVAQKLTLLKKSEEERDAAKAALDEQNSLLTQLKDTKGELDKKKKDLEKELEKTKKKLSDAVSSMKAIQDDNAHLRNAIIDCRRYSDRIASIADKAVPPPKKEEKEKEKKIEEKEKTKESPDAEVAKTIEDEIANGSLVLSDETGGDQLVEMDSSETQPAEEAKEEVQA